MMKNMFGLVNDNQLQFPQEYAHEQYHFKPVEQPKQSEKIKNKKDVPPISPELVEKMNTLYKLLHTVCTMLDEEKIPFYLDLGTLLGCIREGRILLDDTNVDITIHLSRWEKLTEIDLSEYGIILKIKNNEFPDKDTGNMLSVYLENENPEYYCNIYANPAFPILDISAMNDNNVYPIPKNPDVYLKQLYGDWTVPSNKHADTIYHRNNGLILSEYKKNWDLRYNIYKCKF
jgi:phosphorylcholine metabolism protein LicD